MEINKAKALYAAVITRAEQAIDIEVGERREYKPETDLELTLLHETLIDALGLPEDHKL